MERYHGIALILFAVDIGKLVLGKKLDGCLFVFLKRCLFVLL